MKKVNLIDYGMGNLRSVGKALELAGAEVVLVSRPEEAAEGAAVVLPGVGAFRRGMCSLEERGLVGFINRALGEKTPFLGICLGLQLLFTESEEHGTHKGLGFIEGRVRRFASGVKIPHMGWNGVNSRIENRESKMFEGIPDNSYFYFVHSYFVEPEDGSLVLAKTEYGRNFVSAIARGNVYGVQFHPEKSALLGIKVLENFLAMVR